MRCILALALALALAAVGCTVNKRVDWAIQRYQAREYVEARQDFVDLEDNVDGMSEAWEARYTAYRGLLHFRLWRASGDAQERALAQQWLHKAARIVRNTTARHLTRAEEDQVARAIDILKSGPSTE